jgi:hypothetical protein
LQRCGLRIAASGDCFNRAIGTPDCRQIAAVLAIIVACTVIAVVNTAIDVTSTPIDVICTLYRVYHATSTAIDVANIQCITAINIAGAPLDGTSPALSCTRLRGASYIVVPSVPKFNRRRHYGYCGVGVAVASDGMDITNHAFDIVIYTPPRLQN